MSNYCPSCMKLVGLETAEPEVEVEELTDNEIHVEVLLKRNCADCYGDMKEYRFEFNDDISSEIEEHEAAHHRSNKEKCDECDGKGTVAGDSEEEVDCDVCDGTGEVDAADDCPDYSLEVSAESNDRTQTHDRHGKLIKSYRYRRSYYGVDVTCTVTCDDCGETVVEKTLSDEAQASAFEDLN